MGARDRAHGLRCRIIVQQDAAPAIDLQIDESRRDEAPRGQAAYAIICRNSPRSSETTDGLPLDENRNRRMPAPAVEDAVGENGLFFVIQGEIYRDPLRRLHI